MSSTNLASSLRGQCVEHTDHAFCLCSRFFPARDVSRYLDHVLPVLTAFQVHYCTCGHGIHAHVDYISTVVHHCPATHCAAYVQDVRLRLHTCAIKLIQFIVDPLKLNNAHAQPRSMTTSLSSIHTEHPPLFPTWQNSSRAGSKAMQVLLPMLSRSSLPTLQISCYPLHPSFPPSYQLYSPEPTIQADIPGHYPNTNVGFHVDTANGHLYDHSNVTYSSAPDMNAGSYA